MMRKLSRKISSTKTQGKDDMELTAGGGQAPGDVERAPYCLQKIISEGDCKYSTLFAKLGIYFTYCTQYAS